MKSYTLLALLLASPALAQGTTPSQPKPCPVTAPCPAPLPVSLYGGVGAGLSYLGGNWSLQNLTTGFNRTTQTNLSGCSGRAEVYLGASWNVPKTDIGLGLEPYFAYSNVRQSDFNPLLVFSGGGITLYDSIYQSMSSIFSVGLDFRPSYSPEGTPHTFYALLGAAGTQLAYNYQGQAGQAIKSTNYPWGGTWGVGYEYRLEESSIGVRFREEFFSRQKITFSDGGSNFIAKIKPNLYSVMLTYKYNFQ